MPARSRVRNLPKRLARRLQIHYLKTKAHWLHKVTWMKIEAVAGVENCPHQRGGSPCIPRVRTPSLQHISYRQETHTIHPNIHSKATFTPTPAVDFVLKIRSYAGLWLVVNIAFGTGTTMSFRCALWWMCLSQIRKAAAAEAESHLEPIRLRVQ